MVEIKNNEVTLRGKDTSGKVSGKRHFWKFLQTLYIKLSYDLGILPIGIYPRKMKKHPPETFTHMFIANYSHFPKKQDHLKCTLTNE